MSLQALYVAASEFRDQEPPPDRISHTCWVQLSAKHCTISHISHHKAQMKHRKEKGRMKEQKIKTSLSKTKLKVSCKLHN